MLDKMRWICVFLVLIILSGCASLNEAEPPLIFNPRRVVGPMPAITDAPVIAASEVTDQVSDKELVLGIMLNGEARAYPINMLTGPSREIINDTLGNIAIAATW